MCFRFYFFQSCEVITTTTWVIADHGNSPGCPGDLTVSRGQQVEILDIPSPTTALVRLVPPGNASTTGYNSSNATNSAFGKQTGANSSSTNTVGSSEQTTNNQFTEGTVPISCLKQPPGGFRSQNEIAGK